MRNFFMFTLACHYSLYRELMVPCFYFRLVTEKLFMYLLNVLARLCQICVQFHFSQLSLTRDRCLCYVSVFSILNLFFLVRIWLNFILFILILFVI